MVGSVEDRDGAQREPGVASVGHPVELSPADVRQRWRRRRRVARVRRACGHITAWLLGVLVAASLVLGVALWSGMLWPPLATVGPSANYVAPDATMYGYVDLALMPEWMILLYPKGNDIAPDASSMPVVWSAVRATLTALQPAQFALSSSIAYKTVAAQAAETPAGSIGVEVYLGSQVQWSLWDRALGGAAKWTGTNPHFDRIAILPGTTPPNCSGGGGTPTGSAVVDLFNEVNPGLQVALNSQDYCELVAALHSQQGAGYPVSTVHSPAGDLPVAPGVLAPTTFAWQPVKLYSEHLDPTALAASVFQDLPSVTEQRLSSGGVQFSNSDNWVLTVTQGETALVLPQPRPTPAAPRWDVGLQEAVQYVSARGGGWPLTAWLATSQLVRCTLMKCGSAYEYEFSLSYQGLPVLPETGTPPPITVQLVGRSAQPVLYIRDVPVPGSPIPGAAAHAIDATAAVAAVAQTPPANLLVGSAQVISVFAAWVPIQGVTPRMEPAWAIGVDMGSQGTETVLVDAYTGSILGTWPTN